jgi:hypothetical protein
MSDEVDAHIENEKKTNKETKKYKDPLFYLAYIGLFWVFIFLFAVATQLWTYLEDTMKYPLFVLEPIPLIILFGWIPYFVIIFLISRWLQRPK